MTHFTKTFRLFVSSTFTDFTQEREILQTTIFKEIESYCQESGFQFQIVDLRWGIEEEAQIDQQTLNICLNEVANCKVHPYPNFLIMASNRYGWIPLPNIIESEEIESILEVVKKEEKEKLLHWYREDKNQCPASFVLKERTGEFVDSNKWRKEELQIQSILCKAIKVLNLSEEVQSKYRYSATEHEAINGIFNYLNNPKNKRVLSERDKSINIEDKEHVFALLREITPPLNASPVFFDSNQTSVSRLKKSLQGVLLDKNIIKVTTSLINELILDNSYLIEFKSQLISLLKQSIDRQINHIKQLDQTQIERTLQLKFLKEKIYLFHGREESLIFIRNYLDNDSASQPLVIYGESGKGKSSLLAKAIENSSSQFKDFDIIYRFVGATPDSSTSRKTLTSIMQELAIEIDANKDDSFSIFSQKVHDSFLSMENKTIVFIDAVDQFYNNDYFTWLPKELPTNVKIVISAIKDLSYKDDSFYFEQLQKRTNNIHEIPSLIEGPEILNALLEGKGRTLQISQKEYFKQQYSNVQSPLYLKVAAEELKYWKSYEHPRTSTTVANGRCISLANNQLDIIKDFICNLYGIHHHNKLFVERFLGYIHASEEGLSQNEIIDILSVDDDFLKQVVPETFHRNISKRVPTSLLSTLLYQIQSFISIKHIEGYDLIKFFHREFYRAIEDLYDIKKYHEDLIKFVEKIIYSNQNLPFNFNRYGRLYSRILTNYTVQYNNHHYIEKSALFLAKFKTKNAENWVDSYKEFTLLEASKYEYAFDEKAYIELLKVKYLIKNYVNKSSKFLVIATFYHKLGGYEYLHVNWKIALKSLLTGIKFFNLYLETNINNLEAKESLSQSYGRVGELYAKHAEYLKIENYLSCNEKIKKSIEYHFKSEKLNLEILKSVTNDSKDIKVREYLRKLGVVYERLAYSYKVIEDTENVRKYFFLALNYKNKSYVKHDDFNGFAMRKLLIVIANFYIESGNETKAKLYISKSIKSVHLVNVELAIQTNNQYYIEQYIKLFELSKKYLSHRYDTNLSEIKKYSNKRGIQREFDV